VGGCCSTQRSRAPRVKVSQGYNMVWVLVVLVFADGQWRDWRSYDRIEECQEVVRLITHHRENVLIAVCAPRQQKLYKEN
jgi:hypothetical protein